MREYVLLKLICLHRFTPKVHFVLPVSFKETREIVKYMRKQTVKIGLYYYIVVRFQGLVYIPFEYFSIIIHYTLWLCHCHSNTIYVVNFFVTYFIKLMNILSCKILQNSYKALEDGHILLFCECKLWIVDMCSIYEIKAWKWQSNIIYRFFSFLIYYFYCQSTAEYI